MFTPCACCEWRSSGEPISTAVSAERQRGALREAATSTAKFQSGESRG